MSVNKIYKINPFAALVINELARHGNTSTLINFQARQYSQLIRVDSLDMSTTSLNWLVCYMYRIRHKINKLVLITEEGGEKPACYPLTDTDACTRKGTLVQNVKNTCVFYPQESS